MKNITLKLFPFLISLCFFFPILKENISSLTVILLALNLLLYKIASKDYTFITKKTFVLTVPFWVILVYSLFSYNFNAGLVHIQHSLFFLIIPLVFALIPTQFFSKEYIWVYFKVLKNICLLITVIYICSYFYNNPWSQFNRVFYNDSTFRNYVYNEFKLFVIHPAYYTSVLVLCTAQAYDLLLKEKKYWEIIYVLIFVLITFLLLTKLNIVILSAVLFFMTIFRSTIKIKYKIIASATSMLLFSLLILFTPGINKRFAELYNSYSVKPKDLAFNSTNIRKAIFDCSVDLAKENWLQGVGFENLQAELNNCYASNYDSNFYEITTYMTHNYYLYILISCGILGFLFYCFYLFNIIGIAYKYNLFLLRICLLNILLMCFVEDYFYRHYGILFFNLILMTFIKFYEYQNTEENRN